MLRDRQTEGQAGPVMPPLSTAAWAVSANTHIMMRGVANASQRLRIWTKIVTALNLRQTLHCNLSATGDPLPGLHPWTSMWASTPGYSQIPQFLRATAGTAIAHLSHRNSVRPSVHLSVTRVDQAKKVQARIIKSSPSAAPKTLVVSGSVTLFQKFHRAHPNRGP